MCKAIRSMVGPLCKVDEGSRCMSIILINSRAVKITTLKPSTLLRTQQVLVINIVLIRSKNLFVNSAGIRMQR
jgi:hypothetical protein